MMVFWISKFVVKVLSYFGRTVRVKLEEEEFWLLFQIHIMPQFLVHLSALKALLIILVEGTVLYLMTVYRSPNFDSERHFCTEFKKFLHDGNLLSKNLLIVGDFNFPYIDYLNHKITVSNKCSLKFLKFCLTSSLQQLVSEPTRNRNILNLFFVSNDQLVAEVSVMPLLPTIIRWQ